MTEEELQLLKVYQKEIEKCWEIAPKLDALNPDLPGSFTGTPSERIERHLTAMQQELNRLQRYIERLYAKDTSQTGT